MAHAAPSAEVAGDELLLQVMSLLAEGLRVRRHLGTWLSIRLYPLWHGNTPLHSHVVQDAAGHKDVADLEGAVLEHPSCPVQAPEPTL